MSPGFKLKFDKMREGNPADSDANSSSTPDASTELYPSSGNTRNLCIVWPDGKRFFINYAYLISGEYIPGDNALMLVFTSHTISMKGQGLELLFNELTLHLPKIIVAVDSRYNEVQDEKYTVNEIQVVGNQ